MEKQQIRNGNVLVRRNQRKCLSRWARYLRKRFIQGAGRLLLSCGIVFVLLFVMFWCAKGPAYISFHEKKSEKNALSELYSQCIHLQANQMTADISQSSFLSTKITGNLIELSSDALSSWLNAYLEQAGNGQTKDIRLLIESDRPYEIELTYKTTDATVRYMMDGLDDVYIDPTCSSALSCSFTQAQIYPRITNGETYGSFVALHEEITVNVPADSGIRCCVVYMDAGGTEKHIAIGIDELPGYLDVPQRQMQAFTLCDSSLQIGSAGTVPLQLENCGKYVLKLSCTGVARLRGYLTGEMLFQNTSTPKNYVLAGQFVDIGSRNNALNVILSADMTGGSQCEEGLYISGEATRMDISGVDPFPDMQMWFRENIYMAPVSLLSVVISMYGLTVNKGSRKVRPRKSGKIRSD